MGDSDGRVFNATIGAIDKVSGPFAKIISQSKTLSAITQAMGEHAKGMGAVIKAVFGEVEHGAEKAERAVEKTDEEIKKLHKDAEGAGKEIEHAGHGRSWLALAGHVQLLRGHFGELNASVGELGHGFSEFLPALGALGAAGSLVGLFELTERASESFSELSKSAIMAGVSAQQFSQLSFAAQMTDVPVESMSNAIFRLNRVMGDSAAGKNANALALFHHLGIELRDASGHMRSAADILPELAEAFAKTTDPTMQARAAMALFGKAGAQMLPMLMSGKEELEEFSKQSKDLDFVPSGDGAKGLEEYHRSMIGLTTAVHGFTMELGSKLAPVLMPIIDSMRDWIAANREWLTTLIADKVKDLGIWLKSIDWKDVIATMKEWGGHLRWVAEHLGGVHAAIGGLVLVMGSPLLGALAAAGGAISTFVGIFRGLALLAMSNPFTAIATALALIAVGIYENWDKIGPYFWRLWGGVVDAFQWAMDKIKPLIDAMKGAIDWVENSWVARQIGMDPAAMATQGNLAQEQAAAAGYSFAAPPLNSAPNTRTQVHVSFDNLPRGAQVSAKSSPGVETNVDVGYSQAGHAGAY